MPKNGLRLGGSPMQSATGIPSPARIHISHHPNCRHRIPKRTEYSQWLHTSTRAAQPASPGFSGNENSSFHTGLRVSLQTVVLYISVS